MYYTANTLCTAHIALNQSRVKEYGNRAVYLKDKQEFEIELHNPHQKSVLAKIFINGIAISGGGLVIRPGQRTFLKRYLDDNRKFKFDTYTVENTSESAHAIAKNGDIKVEFYYEKEPTSSTYWTGNITLNQQPWQQPFNNYYNTCDLSKGLVGGSGTTTLGLYSSNAASGAINISNASYTSNATPICDSFNAASAALSQARSASPIETGRVEKGGVSDQQLTTVYEEFNSYSSETQTLKIMPFSQKPHEISELRNYCTSCSTRIKKSSWKFCPTCAAPLTD